MITELELFVPGFAGFVAPEWASLLSAPRRWAARQYAEIGPEQQRELDESDYLRLFEEVGDHDAQRKSIAGAYVQMFAIKLALSLGIPHGLRFLRYDGDADQIVASLPLGALRWILANRTAGAGGHSASIAAKDRKAIVEHVPGFVLSAAAADALRRLDRERLGKLLGGFTSPRIGISAPIVLARRDADLAFADSIDWKKLRTAAAELRRAKRRGVLEDAFGSTLSPPVAPR